MNRRTALGLYAALAIAAGGALVSAQIQLPSAPRKQFGASISPAFEGWFDNADGTHNFLIGYYNRNTASELDIPIGPNNHFEPGPPDMGQPTHFLTSRRFGMFVVTVPKEFPKTQKITWTLTANGVTTSVPFHMHTDYNMSPLKSSEESANGAYNRPPQLRFEQTGPSFTGPGITVAKAIAGRTATVGVAMPFDIWADDDALYSTGGGGPMNNSRPPLSLVVSKYRGPGDVTLGEERIKVEVLKGGKPNEPYAGKASPTVKFSQPGDYMLHVTANDYSGNGGGGSGCCWTNGIVKVTVKPAGTGTNGGQ